MSILKKPYEITVWEDEYITNEDGSTSLQEVCICSIGSDTMTSQSRAIEPTLSRNVNGTKKLTFKMYKYYIDNITGEQVENPLVSLLVSERKVKLYYNSTWYDFIVKNIVENSSNYLYTYTLEDALVQELAKNGFNVTFDSSNMDNLGDAKELAEKALADTDWLVESEVFVDTVEDALVYLTFPSVNTNNYIPIIKQVKDQTTLTSGVDDSTVIDFSTLSGKTILAFYSSCRNKPHRFQFIYSSDGYDKEDGISKISCQDDRIINQTDCQYYIDFSNPRVTYIDPSTLSNTSQIRQLGLWLPAGFTIGTPGKTIKQGVEQTGQGDNYLSTWYRGKRYGFAQQSAYVPLLEKYCYKAKKGGEDYYYYIDSEYTSPTTIQNFISGYNFESNAGWTAASSHRLLNNNRPEVEALYGRFASGVGFSTIIDEFQKGWYSDTRTYYPYLKVTFKGQYQFLLNSGPRDYRSIIKKLEPGESWVLDCEIYDEDGIVASGFTYDLAEFQYDTSTGTYQKKNDSTITQTVEDGKTIFSISSTPYTEETFKKNSKYFIQIIPPTDSDEVAYYIKKCAFYRLVRNSANAIIEPDYSATESASAQNFIENCTLNQCYHYFSASQLASVTNKDFLETATTNYPDYATYVPVYNTGAKKIRSITEKESNYFNILQKIAETFEAWLLLEVTRDETTGAILTKKAVFKNYVGRDNYANFRYGLNLKDIQRTFTSNNIVTKLLVKANSNEQAKNGFCTIQRAGANPTGENYIYDFQYYQNMGIMNVDDYLQSNYYIDGAAGPDGLLWQSSEGVDGEVTTQNEYNLNGYFLRLKKINNELEPISETLTGLETDLLKKKATLETMNAQAQAAENGLVETADYFISLTGMRPEDAQDTNIGTVELVSGEVESDNSLINDLYGEQERVYQSIVPQEEWWELDGDIDSAVTINENKVTVKIKTTDKKEIAKIVSASSTSGMTINSSNDVHTIEVSSENDGIKIGANWEANCEYIITCQISLLNDQPASAFPNFGIEARNFTNISCSCRDSVYTQSQNFREGQYGSAFYYPGANAGAKFFLTFVGTYTGESAGTDCIKIIPNRQSTQLFRGKISKIKAYKKEASNLVFEENKYGSFYLNTKITPSASGASPIYRSFDKIFTLPAGASSMEVEVTVNSIDLTRSDVVKYLTEYTAYLAKRREATESIALVSPEVTDLETQITNLKTKRETILEYKTELNKKFFSKYCRFIQEGTWIDEEYIDDDKYFADAQSVLYNSCYPQVAYTINVLSLKGLPGYELIDFDLGDKTNVIDEKFFGNDYKEEVIITEILENLDKPSNNIIKVQNFKNQFQDLFQKITATVQQTQYNSGTYKKGSQLVEANAAKQTEFITNALSRAQAVLSSKNNDVQQTDAGIIITNTVSPLQQLWINSEGILLGKPDAETGEQVWKLGLTSDGISANLITAGQIDTGKLQIMAGTDPTFKWDAYGISAYGAVWSDLDGSSTISGVNTKKFVRFDKNGIYGINNVGGVDGASWKPTSLDEIREKASFALTWDGLFLSLGEAKYTKTKALKVESGQPAGIEEGGAVNIWHNSTTKLGKTGEYIYNSWCTDPSLPLYGMPYYDHSTSANDNRKFVKILSIGGENGEELAIYDDGNIVCRNIKVTGSIGYAADVAPTRTVYGRSSLTSAPDPGTRYSDFDDTNAEEWHKNSSTEDVYYCRTDNAGATWQGPFLITGKSIVETETQYATSTTSVDPNNYETLTWGTNLSSDIPGGTYIYTRVRDVYNNNSMSEWRYSVAYVGSDQINCYVSSSLGNFYNESLPDETEVTFYARVYRGSIPVTNLVYTWYISDGTNDETVEGETDATFTTTLGNVKEKDVHFSAVEAESQS